MTVPTTAQNFREKSKLCNSIKPEKNSTETVPKFPNNTTTSEQTNKQKQTPENKKSQQSTVPDLQTTQKLLNRTRTSEW